MAAVTCAWCKSYSSMILLGTPVEVGPGAEASTLVIQGSFQCSHCKRVSVATMTSDRGQVLAHAAALAWWTERNERLSWTPESVGGRDFPDVPEHIASAGDEAYRCRSIRANRAAMLLARSVVEATAKDKGITTGTLASKIDQLEAKGLVRGFTKEAAHELRVLGNDMAHGDFVDEVDATDCDAVLAVMSEILDEVYQGPARVLQMKSKRATPGSP